MATRDRKRSGKRSSRNERSSSKKTKRTFTYKKRSAEAVKKRTTQGAGNRDQIFKDGFAMFKSKEDNNIRILPPTWDGAEHYAFDLWVHYGIGPDDSAFICLDKLDEDDSCPICEERAKAEASGDSDYAAELKPTRRPACYVIDRDNEDDGPLIWAMPWTVDRDLSAQSFDKSTGEVVALDDPDDGYDVSFERQGKGMKTKYVGISIGRKSCEASDDIDEILEKIQETPIPDTLEIKDSEYISSIFAGNNKKSKDEDDDDDDDNDDVELLSWKEIHKMDLDELEEYAEDNNLDDVIDFDDYDKGEEEDFADVICSELKIKEPKKTKSSKKRTKEMRRNRK